MLKGHDSYSPCVRRREKGRKMKRRWYRLNEREVPATQGAALPVQPGAAVIPGASASTGGTAYAIHRDIPISARAALGRQRVAPFTATAVYIIPGAAASAVRDDPGIPGARSFINRAALETVRAPPVKIRAALPNMGIASALKIL